MSAVRTTSYPGRLSFLLPQGLCKIFDMRFEDLSFGSIRIDGVVYEHDVVVDSGTIRRRKKKPSRKFRTQFAHTPLSIEEKIPWRCRRLVIGNTPLSLRVPISTYARSNLTSLISMKTISISLIGLRSGPRV